MKHPISLFHWADSLIKHNDWLTWEAETVRSTLSDMGHILSKEDFNKLMAVKTLHITDAPWDNWELFLFINQALNGLEINRESIYITDNPLPYLYNTVEIFNLIREQHFNEEVKRFCAAIFLHENVQYCPEPLNFAQIYVSQPTYICKDCGKKGSAMPPFSFVCEDCGDTYNLEKKQKPFNFKPLEMATNVTIELTYPIEDIKKRYEEVKDKKEIELQETDTDIQVGKLILAKDYVTHQLSLLETELSTLHK